MAGNFSGGSFSRGSFSVDVPKNIGAGGPVPDWREEIRAKVRLKELEETVESFKKKITKVEKRIEAKHKQVATAQTKFRPVEGILANLWKLEEKKEALEQELEKVVYELDAVMINIAAQFQIEDEDEEDIEVLIL